MEALKVAGIIRDQIGGRAFFMMGAKDLVGSKDSLQFSIRGSKAASKIVVTLEPSDTYTVAFYKGRGVSMKKVREIEFVYAGDLKRVIESATGLALSL